MNRTDLINYMINKISAKRYLEIGVHDEGLNFALINCESKTGVDPVPMTTFCGTSDEFFAQNTDEFEVIFIDGLHTEEQTITDVENAFRCLSPGGTIILHDCMPPDTWHQRSPETFIEGEPWNGTVWKAALRLFNQTTYKCTLLDTDWGCGIIETAQSQVPAFRDLPALLDYDQHYDWLLAYKVSVPDYFRLQVKVFYHLACMGNWQEVFTEQMEQIDSNGFRDICLTILGSDDDLKTVNSVCSELNLTTEVLFHDASLTCFETPALLAIEEYARHHNGYVLYLHSKGVSCPTDKNKAKWRRLMMHELVENSENCLLQLHRYAAIGVNWRDMPPISHFSGNFWYASTAYLRKLANFKDYYENPRYQITDFINDRRLGCEFWIGSAPDAPNMLSLVCRNVDMCTDEFWKTNEVEQLTAVI